MKKIFSRRLAAVVGIAGTAVMGLSTMGVGAADAGPLPGGTITKTLVDGTPVTISLTDEAVTIARATTNIQTSREVWLSGKVRVNVGGEAEGGSIRAGYIVGCQLDFGAGADGGVSQELSQGAQAEPEVGGGFTLGPGQASYVPIISQDGGDISDYTFSGSQGGVAYSQEKFGLDGCAGFAEAKAKIEVTVETDSVKGVVVLHGKPFSIG